MGLGATSLAAELKQFESWLIDMAGEEAEQAHIDSLKRQMSPLFEHISTITEGSDRVKEIVEDLRCFTHQDSKVKESVLIGKKLQATLNLVKPNYIETTDFVCDFDEELTLGACPRMATLLRKSWIWPISALFLIE